MFLKKKEATCHCSPDCCGDAAVPTENLTRPTPKNPVRQIKIDFLYLDLSVCTRCQGTDDTLDQALAEVSQILNSAGVEVVVNKVNVKTEALAIQYEFVSSPTIRIDGRDIAIEFKEDNCDSCGDLCGDSVDCRVWTWQGEDYTQPPKAMLIDAILKSVYGSPVVSTDEISTPYVLPENLKKFYAGLYDQKNPPAPCCS